MPKLNTGRTVGAEDRLAKRIAYERERRGQSYEGLAKAMSSAGCSISGSSIYKIEKGSPARGVSVDEMVTLAGIWDLSLEELLEPVELLQQRRAQELAKEIPHAMTAFYEAVQQGLRLYLEYGRIAADSLEMLEYLNHHSDPHWESAGSQPGQGVDLGDLVTEEEVREFAREVDEVWFKTLRLATKAAGPMAEE